MGLINCPECSREVSDRAASCPQCGSPITADNVTLTLTGFARWGGYNKPVDVYFNGSKVGSVGRAEELSLTFPSGGNVEFVTEGALLATLGKEGRVSIDVPGGTVANLGFEFGALGGLKVVDQNADSGVVGFVGYSMDL
jgi:hypothetical protein